LGKSLTAKQQTFERINRVRPSRMLEARLVSVGGDMDTLTYALAQKLKVLATTPVEANTTVVALGATTDLDQWRMENGFICHGGWWEAPAGVLRRFSAGMKSLQNRGRYWIDFRVDPVATAPQQVEVTMTSTGGAWTERTWYLTTSAQVTPEGVTCINSVFSVRSSADKTELTTFFGGPLDKVVADVLRHHFESEGARNTAPSDSLTPEEVNEWHDLHGEPVKAFYAGRGSRVVFYDDPDGRSAFSGSDTKEVKEFRMWLLHQGLEAFITS